jgi:hypothetical protein
MWLFDFETFYLMGQAVLAGARPISYTPYPLAVLFVPFALLPYYAAYALYLIINLLLIWKVAGKRMVWALLSFPVMYLLFVGQVDILVALPMVLGFPWTFPLICVKPHVGLLVVPWLLRKGSLREWMMAGVLTLAYLGLCFLLRPTWLQEWLSVIPTLADYSSRTTNIYALIPSSRLDLRATVSTFGVIASFLVALAISNRKISLVVMNLFAANSNVYSPAILAEWIGPIEVVLSWIAIIVVGGNAFDGSPLYMIGISILVRQFIQERYPNLGQWRRFRAAG